MLDSRLLPRHQIALFAAVMVISLGIFLIGSRAFAQNRVDLEDLNIKGELLNDNRLRLSSRDPHKITDRVNYRTNFRKEITDSLEIAWPEGEGAGTTAAEAAKGDDE